MKRNKDGKDASVNSSSSHPSSSSFSIFFRGKAEKDSSNDEASGGTYDYEDDTVGSPMNSNSSSSMSGSSHHFNSNSNFALRRFLQIQFAKLKRFIFFQFNIRGVLVFLFLVYVASAVVVPWLNEPVEDLSWLVPDEFVAEGNEPYGLNFRSPHKIGIAFAAIKDSGGGTSVGTFYFSPLASYSVFKNFLLFFFCFPSLFFLKFFLCSCNLGRSYIRR